MNTAFLDPEPGRRGVDQPRCVYCKHEHYGAAVPLISQGLTSCHQCGKVPPVYWTRDEYQQALHGGSA